MSLDQRDTSVGENPSDPTFYEFLRILEEPRTALSAKASGRDEVSQQWTRCVAVVLETLLQHLHDRDAGVETGDRKSVV